MVMVSTLRKFPDKWWDKFESRHLWFDEDGEPKKTEQLQPNTMPCAKKMTIKQHLENIGANKTPASKSSNDKMECSGTRLDELEIQLLGGLLEKMLQYQPEDRIKIGEVISHPWFSLE